MRDKYFTVLPVGGRPVSGARSRAFLVSDNWDDWFEFSTLYHLFVFDDLGTKTIVGGVKIGEFGMKDGQRRPNIPDAFDELGEEFFSLGQDDSYYEALNDLGDDDRDRILYGLRDVAKNIELFERATAESVTRTSLLRSVSPLTVRGQFARLARGDARLTRYDFTFTTVPASPNTPPLSLSFQVEPESEPPTNIHVLIGRNGVGKTRVLRHMSRSLMKAETNTQFPGVFESNGETDVNQLFANLVSVSFSAFDPFEHLRPRKDLSQGLRYSYIGLQRVKTKKDEAQLPKSTAMLKNEFVRSVKACRMVGKVGRWRQALGTLEADPLFREAEVTDLAVVEEGEEWERTAGRLFARLSSGHAIVLLTITRLVETVDERTLVLLDEPEAHLHPPLLSAFVRAISNLLAQRNAVSIIATHSPVVLQEVPRTCVWKLHRSGHEARANRPEIETFGENLGVLTREAFGLEVTEAGFHRLIREVVEQETDYEDVCDRFDNQLGAEARAIIRALLAVRNAESGR